MPYPYVRKATPDDYESIWEIWMQDHIIQWMSFKKQSKEDFKEIFTRLSKESDIYVIVDEIDKREKITGVRRIKFGKGPHSHIAEYCSMGVHQDYLGRGYGKLFYTEFEKIVKKNGAKRIQLTQSGGNDKAFNLANKDFTEEARFADWLPRKENNEQYYLIERYIYKIIDPILESKLSTVQNLTYNEKIPQFSKTEKINIACSNNDFICSDNNEPFLKVNFEPDDSVIPHIGFLSIDLYEPFEHSKAIHALQEVLEKILQTGRVKKLELFSSDPRVLKICQDAGFFVRGQKIASRFENNQYHHELGVDYSFFNIDDAKKLARAKVSDPEKLGKILGCLNGFELKINQLKLSRSNLEAAYYENFAYQIVRDDLGPNNVFSLEKKPWENLLPKLPTELNNALVELRNQVMPSKLDEEKSNTKKLKS